MPSTVNLEVMARVSCSDLVLGVKTGENSGNIKYKDKNVERVLSANTKFTLP